MNIHWYLPISITLSIASYQSTLKIEGKNQIGNENYAANVERRKQEESEARLGALIKIDLTDQFKS